MIRRKPDTIINDGKRLLKIVTVKLDDLIQASNLCFDYCLVCNKLDNKQYRII